SLQPPARLRRAAAGAGRGPLVAGAAAGQRATGDLEPAVRALLRSPLCAGRGAAGGDRGSGWRVPLAGGARAVGVSAQLFGRAAPAVDGGDAAQPRLVGGVTRRGRGGGPGLRRGP